MTHHDEGRRLVVAGVSALDARRSLVAFAADEAAARGAELRLVTVRPAPAMPDTYLPADPAPANRAVAERELADMAAHAREGRPGLVVSTDLVLGLPAEVLRTAARDAELLVVGADEANPVAEAVSGSVPGDLLTTAPCPLAVVPRDEPAVTGDAPVVVALDEHGTAQAAVAYGFGAAARSGRPLTVLHCQPPGPRDTTGTVEQALTEYRGRYPGVAVTDEIVRGDPRHVLTDMSRSAALLVVGSRGHGRLASTLLGSVSRHLIRTGGCPVVVARVHKDARQHAATTG